MLKLTNVKKSFGGVLATNDLSIDFTPGSLSAIIGPNGAGKTTLFNLIAGRLRPDSGSIVFNNEEISGLPATEIVHKGIARAFQVASLFPSFSVQDSFEAAVLARHRKMNDIVRPFSQAESRDRAHHLMQMVGLESRARTLAKHLPHGEQKLLDIGLALALEPRLLLLDEPTAGMGPEERFQMIERVHELWEREQLTLIFIEHDMDIVFAHAQVIRVLYYGALLAEGTPAEIRNNQAVIDAYLGAGFEEEVA
ncbi:ABC transporter ATP-binding protein [Pollutimonas nitritireducens]|uniref:ABC transporter ATP-binding protein n=1 Tax=Pollutimonas nitritireducens TaxID=2045209 RepID=A0A2N4UB79_9BURK|nr:ABC transporter ATP-binding protein [Pollutimonas nitritireducens]PLC52265.1 ABC transporter ATP-binding protein [Pollutimonas nitritireducens]